MCIFFKIKLLKTNLGFGNRNLEVDFGELQNYEMF